MSPSFIKPAWPAPACVRALQTTRVGGVSAGGWQSLNLGMHCGDDPAAVLENRRRLAGQLPAPAVFPRQVHGTRVATHGQARDHEADAILATRMNDVCGVLTADCLPVLFTDRDGTQVAAAHAGWRGLAAGVLEAAVAAMPAPADRLLAWLGPAIGPDHFEVGAEVREAFLAHDPSSEPAFKPSGDRWHADLYHLARLRLAKVGLRDVYGGGSCTVCDAQRYFSYRRDGETGRMATLIWLQPG